MKLDLLMPQMGESITEATIVKWLKHPGEQVQKDEAVLEISTEKVDSEVPAPASGVLTEVLFKEGDTVPVRVKIAVIDTEGQAQQATTPGEPPRQEAARTFSPLAKSVADKHQISQSERAAIEGSGQQGRVVKKDVLEHLTGKKVSREAPQRPPVPPPPPSPPSVSEDEDWEEDGTRVIPMDNMRQLIADHMVRSKATSAHVYSVQEVDMNAVAKWRAAHKAAFKEQEGFNLSFTPFFLEATVKALLQYPYLNASVEGKKIVLHRHVNLGCAVALGTSGLIVPVIMHAEEKNLVGLARNLNELAAKARSKHLSPAEVLGGTFTVTNPGAHGTVIGTPNINQPQVAILCIGAIKKRPVVVDDMIAIREICFLTLTYDHRIIDGVLAAEFTSFIREYLENWNQEQPLY